MKSIQEQRVNAPATFIMDLVASIDQEIEVIVNDSSFPEHERAARRQEATELLTVQKLDLYDAHLVQASSLLGRTIDGYAPEGMSQITSSVTAPPMLTSNFLNKGSLRPSLQIARLELLL